MSPVFSHGDLRLYLLNLLDEGPRHGYDIMQALSDRTGGTYTPSAGTIYPAPREARGRGPRDEVRRRPQDRLRDHRRPDAPRSPPARAISRASRRASPTRSG